MAVTCNDLVVEMLKMYFPLHQNSVYVVYSLGVRKMKRAII